MSLPIFVEKVKPQMEVKSRRVGGATYQVPMEVRPARQEALTIRGLVTYARSRKEKDMVLINFRGGKSGGKTTAFDRLRTKLEGA